MDETSVNPEYRDIVKLFKKLTGSKSMWQVFNDCIEAFALSFQDRLIFGERFEKNEKRYKQIISQYSEQEVQVIAEILEELVKMVTENPFRDLLGDLYMQLDMGSKDLGQFFTPYSIAYAMARLAVNIDNVKKIIADKGYITINEPTCGGGANIIAICELMHKNNINYQSSCVIVCQDLSKTAALMCYIVLSLLGCSAVIKIADTLSDPFISYHSEIAKGSEIWTTPMFHFCNCYHKV